jgi:5-methylcytosine-specific restriction endonuclease McrA
VEQYKTCTMCGQNLSNSNFSPSKLGKYGTRSKCKPCCALASKNYRIKNPDKVIEYGKLYRQQNPEKIKSVNKRFRDNNPDYAKKYHSEHRQSELLRSKIKYWKDPAKESLRKKKAREQHPEVFKERNKKYRENNVEMLRAKAQRRRARLVENNVFLVSKKELKKLYSSTCFYCANPAQTIDHVIPIARGGAHGIGNLVPACNHCNFSKAGRTVMEWRVWKVRLGL